MIRKQILLFYTIILISCLSCSQWKVTTLKNNKVLSIKNGKKPGEVYIATDSSGLKNLSIGVNIFNDKIVTTDNKLKRLQILDTDGSVELILGKTKGIKSKKIKKNYFKFTIIDNIFISKEDNIYVQNRFPHTKVTAGYKQVNSMGFAPSYIVVFNRKGELQYTLGATGKPNIPFYNIENLFVDSDERLFVISQSAENWTVYGFKDKRRFLYVNLGKFKFLEKDGSDVYKGKIENVRLYSTGDKLIVSVAYYHGLRLKYRKIYDYFIKEDKLSRAIINIPDPKNVLFNIVKDSLIYFWNIESKDVKFMICDMEGNIINNILLKSKAKKGFYNKIIGKKSGSLYSYVISKRGISVFSWD